MKGLREKTWGAAGSIGYNCFIIIGFAPRNCGLPNPNEAVACIATDNASNRTPQE